MHIDPKLLAQTEVSAWKAYYRKNEPQTFTDMIALFQKLYQMTPEEAKSVATPYAKAMGIFGRLPQDTTLQTYNHLVLPWVEKSYITLSQYYPLKKPDLIATTDLSWWIARRTPSKNTVQNIGMIIAKMYAEIYNSPGNLDFERAGFIRAAAMQYRDLSSNMWNGVSDFDWQMIQNMLFNGYQLLEQGIQK